MPIPRHNAIAPPWPYDWQELDSALDVETIEIHGAHQLHRALNVKRLIAFVGSGVSMAYGRVAWSELARLHIDMMSDFLNENPAPPRGDALVSYIHALRTEPEGLRETDRLYAALHACEQIWRLTARNKNSESLRVLAEAFGFNWGDEEPKLKERLIDGEERGSFLFRTWVKRETYDELHHARRLIRGWQLVGDPEWIPRIILSKYEEFSKSDNLQSLGDAEKELKSTRQLLRSEVGLQPQRYLRFFERPFLDALKAAAPSMAAEKASDKPHPIPDIVQEYHTVAALCRDGVNDYYLRPVRGFAVALALDLARLIAHLDTSSALPLPVKWIKEQSIRSPTTKIKPSDRHVRRSAQIPIDSDPLYCLTYNLGIKRFLTTNYDLEIERLFTNMGFSAQEGIETDRKDDVEMVGPTGGRTRDFVLTRNSAIDLIDFAANDSPYEFQVVHLHGRATDYHDIVITEADYQRTYVRETANETAFKEGIEIAFGGNPILFLGLSLSEGDVLRPLREFMTGPSRRNRAIIALRDGTRSKLERDTFCKNAYSRYGVHVIHYGRVTSGGNELQRPYWLDSMHAAIATLMKNLEVAADAVERELDTQAALQEIKEIKFEIKDKDCPSTWSVLDKDFESDGYRCDIMFEVRILQVIQRLAPAICALAKQAWIDSIADAAQQKKHRQAVTSFLRTVLRGTAERTETAIITAALTAKLAGIKADWDQWWRNWRTVPLSRSYVAEFERLYAAGRAVWGRHIGKDGKSIPRRPPALDEFLQVVRSLSLPLNNTRRRVFALVGARGSGKGNIFNAFVRHGKEMLGITYPDYAGQFFATFSFSVEIASVWDALIAFIHDQRRSPNLLLSAELLACRAGEDVNDGFFQNAYQQRHALTLLPRLDALRRVLTELHGRLSVESDISTSVIPRVLIVLNAFDILLDEEGLPKNNEVAEILDLLLGPDGMSAPIDLVLICRDTGLPHQYRKGNTRRSRQSQKALAASPRAMTLLLSDSQKKYGRSGKDAFIHRELVSIVRNSNVLLTAVDGPNWLSAELGLCDNNSLPCTSENYDYFHVIQLPDPYRDWSRFHMLRTRLDTCTAAAMERVDSARFAINPMHNDFRPLDRLFYVHLERQRFLYTLVLAVANYIEGKSEPLVWKDEQLTGFMQRLIAALRGPGISAQDRTVEIVLDYWFEKLAELATTTDGPNNDPILHETILRNLAVIGTPVKPLVLIICPEVRNRLRFLGVSEADYMRIIITALNDLVERRLVFGVLPPGGTIAEEASESDNALAEDIALKDFDQANAAEAIEMRYVVHRSIQRYVFRKLGSQRLEPSEGQLFTISLQKTQQRQFPRLNEASYKFIYELVTSLSAYPSAQLSMYLPEVTKEDEIKEIKNWMSISLRAALGTTRNLFSIGVVSRLSDLGNTYLTKLNRLGYFEHHRLIVRWMFYYARFLYDKEPFPSEWPPFYRDELVWLTNESAVFLQAQGQIYDASALLWFARQIALEIEGLRTGILQTRILLNDAWCCIDRARLDDAEARYRRVLAIPETEEVLRYVANGGLALVEHLRGRLDSAAAKYHSAIRGLNNMGRSRPVAEFQRNLGDLMRHLNRYDEAETELLKSVQIAEAGGYMELVHLAQVARVRNQIEKGAGDTATFTDLLNLAQEYAEKMDLARLLCEILMVRSLLLIRHGHSMIAGQFITRAIRIATLSGLSLRKIAYMELLARVEHFRGGRESADRLRNRTIQAAHNVGYNLVVDRAERARDELTMVPVDFQRARDGRHITAY